MLTRDLVAFQFLQQNSRSKWSYHATLQFLQQNSHSEHNYHSTLQFLQQNHYIPPHLPLFSLFLMHFCIVASQFECYVRFLLQFLQRAAPATQVGLAIIVVYAIPSPSPPCCFDEKKINQKLLVDPFIIIYSHITSISALQPYSLHRRFSPHPNASAQYSQYAANAASFAQPHAQYPAAQSLRRSPNAPYIIAPLLLR